ncbi:MAG TPA: flagellar brake protein [Burkholderiaceae bacterium]|nr:flagellar brake protein [Burkholderiaceae bacterium]
MPLDAMAAAQGGLDEFCLRTPTEIAAVLRLLQEGNVELNLNAPHGTVYTTTLWTADAARGLLSFAADPADAALQGLLEGDEAVAVAYLESIKIQFDVERLVLVHGTGSCALTATYPREVFRFQRRASYRVRPVPRDTPTARLRHPMLPEMALALRVLDLSIGGCALLLPDDVPPLPAGVLINGVQIELDLQTRFETALRLHHVTAIHAGSRAVRLGCELVGAGHEVERVLQRYIDQTQKRRRFLAA